MQDARDVLALQAGQGDGRVRGARLESLLDDASLRQHAAASESEASGCRTQAELPEDVIHEDEEGDLRRSEPPVRQEEVRQIINILLPDRRGQAVPSTDRRCHSDRVEGTQKEIDVWENRCITLTTNSKMSDAAWLPDCEGPLRNGTSVSRVTRHACSSSNREQTLKRKHLIKIC